MRHKKAKSLFNRFTSWRKATLISLARNLLVYQSIKTTLQKANSVKPLAEKLISLTKRKDLAAKREAFRILGDHKLVKKLFQDIGSRFANKGSGFVRIIKLGPRRGDNANMVILELTEIKKKEMKAPKKTKEIKEEGQAKPETGEEKKAVEKKPEAEVALKERPPVTKKPSKKFLGGIRNIFKKERDSL